MEVSEEIINQFTSSPSNTILGHISKGCTNIPKRQCPTMFIADLFVITWKQSRYPSIQEWIKKMCYIFTREYYLAVKNNGILKFACKFMELGKQSSSVRKQDLRRQIWYIFTHKQILAAVQSTTILPFTDSERLGSKEFLEHVIWITQGKGNRSNLSGGLGSSRDGSLEDWVGVSSGGEYWKRILEEGRLLGSGRIYKDDPSNDFSQKWISSLKLPSSTIRLMIIPIVIRKPLSSNWNKYMQRPIAKHSAKLRESYWKERER